LNRNNSSNVQTWSVRLAAIAGVLCFQRRLPSTFSIFSASWGLTRLNHAKKRHKCIISGFKRLEESILPDQSTHAIPGGEIIPLYVRRVNAVSTQFKHTEHFFLVAKYNSLLDIGNFTPLSILNDLPIFQVRRWHFLWIGRSSPSLVFWPRF